MQLSSIDASLVAMVSARTSRPVGYVESPTGVWKHPAIIIYPVNSAPLDGSLGEPHQMGDLTYQFTVTGETALQASKGEERLVSALKSYWKDITGCCGLVSISRQGIVRVEDRLYQAVVSATIKESAV